MDTIGGGVAVVFGGHGAAGTEQDETEHREKSGGPVRWFATVDDEDAGLVYRAFTPLLFAWIGIAVTGVRTDRSTPPVDLHQGPMLGVDHMTLGHLIFVWNIVTSWVEGPDIEDGDPWGCEGTGTATNE